MAFSVFSCSFSLSFPLVCFFVRSFIMTLCCVMFGLFSSVFIFVLLILHWPSVVSFSFFLRSSFVYFLVGSGIILCFSLQHVIRTAIKSGWVREVLLIMFMMVLGSLNRYASLVLSISGHSCVIFLRSFFVNFPVGSGIILCFSLQ